MASLCPSSSANSLPDSSGIVDIIGGSYSEQDKMSFLSELSVDSESPVAPDFFVISRSSDRRDSARYQV